MQPPPYPDNEQQRLRKLHALQILDTAPERRFDRVTSIARRLFDVQAALVSLVDCERQWFKSANGLALRQTPRETSFCGHAILGNDVFVVPDAQADERFFDNPLVVDAPGIRFYAGCPLALPSGLNLGTLCLLDRQPRMFSKEDRQSLRDLADIVLREIVALDLATVDELTGVPNQRAFDYMARQALNFCRRIERRVCLVFFDMQDFKQVNDCHGHAEGDRALAIFGSTLLEVLRESDPVGRIGGDEFAALLPDADKAAAEEVVARIRTLLAAKLAAYRLPYTLGFSAGIVEYDAGLRPSFAEMREAADREMYCNKKAGKALQAA